MERFSGIKPRDILSHPAACFTGTCLTVLCRWLWYAVAALLLMLAVGVTVLRVWLPSLAERKADLESFLSARIAHTVRIDSLEAYWKGMHPRLRARGLTLGGAGDAKAAMHLDEIRLRVAWLPLLKGELVFEDLVLVHPVVPAVRLSDGRIAIADLMTLGKSAMSPDWIMLGWLLRQNQITIENGEFFWEDRLAGTAPLEVTKINLGLVNDNGIHRFTGSMSPPHDLSRELQIEAQLDGFPLFDPSWRARINLNASDLNLGEMPPVLRERLPGEISGHVMARLRTQWTRDGLVQADGSLSVRDLGVASARMAEPLQLKALQGEIQWERDDAGWRVQVNNLQATMRDRPWPLAQVQARLDSQAEVFNARVTRMRVDDLVDLLGVAERATPAVELVRSLKPRGEARDLRVRLDGPLDAPRAYSVDAQVSDAAMAAYRGFPGLAGIDGTLSLTNTGGEFRIDSRDAELDLPKLYEHPLAVGVASGRLVWEKRDDHWWLLGDTLRVSNADARGNGNLEARIPFDKSRSPYLKLHVDFRDGNGKRASYYYPRKKMPPKTVEWLDRAIVDGRITGGSVQYEGRTREFPFTNGDGRFEVVAHVVDGVVDYAKDWPRVEGAEADLLFNKSEMLITGRGGTLHGLDIEDVSVHIQDLKDPAKVVEVRGRLAGPFGETVDFLQTGPLLGKNRITALGITGNGRGALTLDLKLPLKDLPATRVAGHYDTQGSQLRFSNGILIDNITGRLDFTEREYTSDTITASLLGGEAQFKVTTPKPGRGADVLIAGKGEAEAAAAAGLVGQGLASQIDGRSAWNGSLRIGRGKADLEVRSDLVGSSSAFPAPLDKKPASAMPLHLVSRYRGEAEQTMDIKVGDLVDTLLLLGAENGKRVIRRGELRVGAGEAVMPAEPGLHLHIVAPRFDLDPWIAFFAAAPSGEDGFSGLLSSMQAQVSDAGLLGQRFRTVDLKLRQTRSQRWQGDLSSAEAQGRIGLDWSGAHPAVALDLDRLRLASGEKGEDESKAKEKAEGGVRSNPAKLPRLEIKARAFSYDDMQLGALELETEPTDLGATVRRLQLSRPDMTLTADGTWTDTPKGQRSAYELNFSSSDLGETMSALGLGGQVKGGTAEVTGSMSWRGGPTDVGLANLDAELSLRARRGRFLNLDPGAGRLFGLFNIDALTRRLTLDFTDVFSKGYGFDKVAGNVTIADGNAYTSDLMLQGPAADIAIAGRAGVVAEDYDLKVTVMPELGSNLALAGGVLGSPAAGAVIYLAQKVFRKQLSNIVRYDYTITGSWDAPVVVKTESPKKGEG